MATGLNGPRGIAVDSSGNVYIGDAGDGRVLKVAPGGAQSTVGLATLARNRSPWIPQEMSTLRTPLAIR